MSVALPPPTTTQDTENVYHRVSVRVYLSLLVHYLQPHKRRVAWLTLFVFGYTGVRLAAPQIVRFFIDTAREGGQVSDLMWAAALYVCVALGRQLCFLGSSYFSQDVGWRATNRMRSELAAHCLRLDMSFHGEHTPGELVERVDGDTSTLANFLSGFAARVTSGLLLLLGVLVLVWHEDWRLGLAMTVFSCIAFFIINLTRSIAVPIYAAEREGFSRLYGFIEERLGGIEDVRTNGAVTFILERFYKVNRDAYGRVVRSEVMGAVLRSITMVLFAFGHAMTMGMSLWLFRDGLFTIGTVYLVFEYMTLLRFPLFMITEEINDLQKATAGLKRIEELNRIRSRIVDGDTEPAAGALRVDFDSVTFEYSADSPVLRDVSFHLEAGRTLGLLGRTGSGKSTLTRLLFRFYDVQQGTIRLGGTPIRDLRLQGVRQRVGMVTQDVQIFRATVRENLALFDEGVDDSTIMHAIGALGLMDWFGDLSQGLDTPITASGLSAGESQLLAFARVFLKDPGLVILDEPSSRLDPATEHRIDRAVHELLRGRTAVIIAHHLATVHRVDDIMILDGGGVQEYGERTRLAADAGSSFAKLLAVGLEDHTT
ncbi:MAG: ABC transporter ATP-binding protein [bacterium]|nr:ABC transporter ATP-binding protein [bacterium]